MKRTFTTGLSALLALLIMIVGAASVLPASAAQSDIPECATDSFGINANEAPTNEEETVLLGDADLNGEVEITDATTIQRYDVKMIGLSDEALTLADVDKDGDVCIIDATWIQRWDLNMKAPAGIGKPL